MDVVGDIQEIGRMMASASLLMAVRREVTSVMRDGFVVTDGSHSDEGSGYDVVVRCSGRKKSEIARRIRAHVPDVNVDRIAEGALGVKSARRGGRLNGV